MRISDLDYALPAELIAQTPAAARDAARLLVMDRRQDAIRHQRVADLPELLSPGDLLILNDTRVVPARLYGHRPTGGRLEVLLVRPVGEHWEAIVRGHPRVGEVVTFVEGCGRWVSDLGAGRWLIALEHDGAHDAWLERVGHLPLPPYIERPEGPSPLDVERYQTVVARVPGAIAAPTAGLHFTPPLLAALEASGIPHVTLTLHVGPGTFLPIRDGDLDGYAMEGERFRIGPEVVDAVTQARARGGRVIAVGTTCVRALESAAVAGNGLGPGEGIADLFIRPGHVFRVVDALLTNFHLPRTPLLALVAALGGWERIRRAYESAIANRYRFYSFGDAMLIL